MLFSILARLAGGMPACLICGLAVLALPGWAAGAVAGRLLQAEPRPGTGGTIFFLLLGAAAGMLAGGGLLFERLGLAGAGRLAALVLGASVAPAVFGMVRRTAREEANGPERGEPPSAHSLRPENGALMEEARFSVQCSSLFSSAFAGAVFFVLVLRIVPFFTGPGFSIALAVGGALLAAAALGTAAGLGVRSVLQRPLAAGGCALVLGGLCACLVPLLLPGLPGFLHALVGEPPQGFKVWNTPFAAFVATLLLAFPGTFFLAMAFFLVMGPFTGFRSLAARERRLLAGVALAGAALGLPAACGFIVPVFGTKMGVVVASFMAVASGLLLFLFSGLRYRWKGPGFVALCAVTLFLLQALAREGGVRQTPFADSPVFRNPGRDTFLVLERSVEDGRCTASLVRDVGARERRLYLGVVCAASTG